MPVPCPILVVAPCLPGSWLMKLLASAARATVVAALAVLRFSTPIVPITPGPDARYVARTTWLQPADPMADEIRDPTSSAPQLVPLLSAVRTTLVLPTVNEIG